MHVKLEGAHPPILLRARSPRLVKIGVKIYSTAYTRNIRISFFYAIIPTCPTFSAVLPSLS